MLKLHYVIVILIILTTIIYLSVLKFEENYVAYEKCNILAEPKIHIESDKLSDLLTSNDTIVELGNIPKFYMNNEKSSKKINRNCGQFPSFFDLKFRNNHWQIQDTQNGTLHLLNAYYDNREQIGKGSLIRVLAMLDRLENIQMKCILWYENKTKPIVTDSLLFNRIFTKGWGGDRAELYQPYLISCPNPNPNELPMSVSIVDKICDKITNNLQLIYEHSNTPKKNFVVCVKGLNFPDGKQVLRLIEWIELLQILGADRIKFYEFNVHPEIKKILDYYKNNKKIEVAPLTLISDRSNLPFYQQKFLKKKVVDRRLQEVIPYNDCFYQHIHNYRYVVLLDTDEVIMPVNGTWIDLMETLEKAFGTNRGGFLARNAYYLDVHMHDHEWFDNIPKYMHMLQHVYRSKNYTKPGYYVKAFFNTKRVITLHNHYPRGCLNGSCQTVDIDISLAQLNHYRSDTVAELRNNKDYKEIRVMDARIWNFKDELIRRMRKVLEDNNISPTDYYS